MIRLLAKTSLFSKTDSYPANGLVSGKWFGQMFCEWFRRLFLSVRPSSKTPFADFVILHNSSSKGKTVKQGFMQRIFLHIDCVPFWDAVPFHQDAAPPGFQSLRPKRKACCHVMPALLCTMSRLPQYPPPFFALPSVLSRSRSRVSPCPTVRCVLPFPLP